jgi:hypothetical protein
MFAVENGTRKNPRNSKHSHLFPAITIDILMAQKFGALPGHNT